MILIPEGYIFSTAQANFRYKQRDDLALILSNTKAICAGVFTRNRFQAAPILICKEILKKNNYKVRGIVINSGIANAGTGGEGLEKCKISIKLVGEQFGIDPDKILPASTGVIGEQFSMKCWEDGAAKLKKNLGKKNIIDVAKAIMTTDTFPKICSKQLSDITVAGIAKGAGMICPNMATMLAFLITDIDVEAGIWQQILEEVVMTTFNRISVDGDTSTNDCVLALANGASGKKLTTESEILKLKELLFEVCLDLSYKIVQDAEGGTKIIHLCVKGANTQTEAEMVARTIAHSPLVKTAFYGEDANWGRIVAAIGRSGADVDIDKIIIKIGGLEIFKHGMGTEKDLDDIIKAYLKKQDIYLEVDLGREGKCEYDMLFSDLSEEYVRINGSYRT